MRIIYLTWGETPRSIGVFGTQVLGQFAAITNIDSNNEYHIICGVPVVNSGLVREKWRYYNEINKCKKILEKSKFHFLHLFTSQNFIYSAELGFKLLHGGAHKRLSKLFDIVRPEIVHCRSYHAAWAALQVRTIYRFKYKIIFDGRDLWPEVVALKNKWNPENASYKYLKFIERALLEGCDASVSVSKPMAKHYQILGAKRDRLIYVSADTKGLLVGSDEHVSSECIRFCYVGALAEGSWHDTRCLVELYRHLRTLFPRTLLTVVTSVNHDNLKKAFTEFPCDELVFVSHNGVSQLKEILKNQDFGLLSYFKPRTELELAVSRIVLAVKVGEYLSSGLPIICNKYCIGTVELIQNQNSLGIVYCPERINDITTESLKQKLNKEVRNTCSKYAVNNFDVEVNAKKYHQLYAELMDNLK